MLKPILIFKENFFAAGISEIFNIQGEKVGSLDLKSAFSSGVDIVDENEALLVGGRIKFFSNKWGIVNDGGDEIGCLSEVFSFFSKRYEYEAFNRGKFSIESDAFLKEYRMIDEYGQKMAHFERTNGFFESAAFRLTNQSDVISSMEMVLVVLGVHWLKRRKDGGAASASI
ncbi:hypothetical protein [Falsibacillus albus]|uniref:LURP-one-related family protein n=1 Tax=Falsibacillus albus TaxID=2478915 RepID=A0A3L7JQJ4_9BACI|nr:hypothetical protein [Falsibacillus albus]RLQ93087.1 hypothetical protein D9X91_18825 [Falsibacillus albus]